MPEPDLPVVDFSAYVAERTRDATGRGWVFEAVDAWLADPNGPQFFVLTGEPGAGKTTIAAWLVRISSGELPVPDGLGRVGPGFLSAVHFCSAHDLRWINPQVFAESLTRQLSHRYDTYAEAVLRSVAPTVTIRQEARENWGRMIAAEIGTLVVTADPENLFNRIVREPLEVLARSAPPLPVVIVVDALDESLAYTGSISIADLVTQTGQLPPGVRFVVTSRPEARLLRALRRAAPVEVTLSPRQGPLEAHVMRDVQDYVKSRVARQRPGFLADGLPVAQFVAAVRDRSEGNFLYVRQLLGMLAAQSGAVTIDSLSMMPAGLDGVYLEFLQRLTGARMTDWQGWRGPVLGVLAVAQAPLTEDQVSAFTGLAPAVVRSALTELRQLLDTDEEQPASRRTYSPYHRSFGEFLLDRDRAEEFWLDEVPLHRAIARHYWDTGRASDDYGLRHLAAHLYHGRDVERLRSLVDEDWIPVRYQRANYSYDGLLDDVDMVWRAVEEVDRRGVAAGEPAPFVADEVRAALCVASIGGLVQRIPPELIRALVRDRTWSPHQGLAHARRIAGGQGLSALASALPEPLATEAYAEAVTVADRVTDAEQRARALTALLPRLPDGPRADALRLALLAVRQLSDRQRVAGGYGHYYASGEGETYVHTGRRTETVTELARTLAGLDCRADPEGRESRLAELLERLRTVCDLEDETQFADEVTAIASALGDLPAVPGSPREAADRPPTAPDAVAGPAIVPLHEAIGRARIGDEVERAAVERGFHAPPAAPTPVPEPGPLSWQTPHLGPGIALVQAVLQRDRSEPALRDAYRAAWQLADEHERQRALIALAPHLTASLAIEAYKAVRDITHVSYLGERQPQWVALMLLGLARRLPAPQRDDALGRLLRPPWSWRLTSPDEDFDHPDSFTITALEFARDLPDSPAATEVRDLISTSAIRAARQARYGRGYAGWNARRQVLLLLSLLPHLVEPHLSRATETLLQLLVEEFADRLDPSQTAVLARYIPEVFLATAESVITAIPLPSYMPEDRLPTALEVARQKRNVDWLHAIVARLAGPRLLDALSAANDIGGAVLQGEVLGRQAAAFAPLEPALRYAAWADTLHVLATLDRPVMLHALANLGPLIIALGGPDAADRVLAAVAEVGEWWP